MTSLWLVRHGQTDWNFAGRWQGQAPHAPGLNEVGRTQALDLLDHLEHVPLSSIYSSDLLRSWQTAELIANPLGLSVKLEPRLREINLGKWEGMLSKDIEAQFPKDLAERARDPLNKSAPRGESPKQVAKRVIAAVHEIGMRHPQEPVLIVAHGISLAIITCVARGISLDRLYDHVPDNAKLSRVEWETFRRANEILEWDYSGDLSLFVKGEGQ